jgi:hypothetical protein
MKPNREQKQWLKDYLRKVMVYRETYEEVYDHMLLAIENHPEQQYFATTVLDILDNDFGGSNGLLALEENCRQAVEATAQVQFRDNFKRWFASPLVVVTAALFMGLFYLQLPNVKTDGALFYFFLFLLVLPVILSAVRGFRLGYKYGERKTSIKDEVFRRLAFTSDRMLSKVFLTLIAVQLTTKYLFMLNDTVGMIIGVLLIFLFVWPAIRRFRLKHKHGDDFKVVPFRQSLISGRLFIVMLASDLTAKYIFKTEHWLTEKSISINLIYGIVTGVMVLMIINIFAVIKLYSNEFKTNMLVN